MIDNDQAVSRNYQRLVSEGFKYVYEEGDPAETLEHFRERSIGEIRDAVQRLFPDLVLNSLGDPLEQGTFKFDKGESQAFLYKNLSGGEKAAFDLLLDILVKKREFDDTVFFVDEPETHMSTALQGALLQELYDLVPENSQLWIATHSLGMMRKAGELSRNHPGQVAFLDFDGINFDVESTIQPSNPTRPFWKRIMQVALDDIAGYVAPEKIVLCEGGTLPGKNDFDANCFNTIFAEEYREVLFIGAGSSDDVQNDPRQIAPLIRGIAPDVELICLIDRDDRRDDEIVALNQNGIRVLGLRTIESYLLHDYVLEALCHYLGDGDLSPQLIEAKQNALQNSVDNGGPADDMKRPAGDIYNAAKELFPGQKLGANKREFMKGLCAPLIPQCDDVYDLLKRDVFGA